MAAYQMYRNTTLGDALQKTLDEQIAVSYLISWLVAISVLLSVQRSTDRLEKR